MFTAAPRPVACWMPLVGLNGGQNVRMNTTMTFGPLLVQIFKSTCTLYFLDACTISMQKYGYNTEFGHALYKLSLLSVCTHNSRLQEQQKVNIH